MITRNPEKIWESLAAPLPGDAIQWRQDGRPIAKDGKHFARFVAYVEATFVWARLDAVVPGEWDSTLELLPPITGLDEDANQGAASFKCRLQILGVIREDVGTGKDYKQAATDAFKRAAVRFGIARELYSLNQNWVQVDGDGRYAKPVEDPAVAYARRHGRITGVVAAEVRTLHEEAVAAGAARGPVGVPAERNPGEEPAEEAQAQVYRTGGEGTSAGDTAPAAPITEGPACPKCDGRMWDNRTTKRNPKAPDYKCRDRSCDGVIWPPKPTDGAGAKPGRETSSGRKGTLSPEEEQEIPF